MTNTFATVSTRSLCWDMISAPLLSSNTWLSAVCKGRQAPWGAANKLSRGFWSNKQRRTFKRKKVIVRNERIFTNATNICAKKMMKRKVSKERTEHSCEKGEEFEAKKKTNASFFVDDDLLNLCCNDLLYPFYWRHFNPFSDLLTLDAFLGWNSDNLRKGTKQSNGTMNQSICYSESSFNDRW